MLLDPAISHKDALVDQLILDKPVCIFENHAHALLPWSRWKAQLNRPLVLLSFDHHSDTNSCYLRSLFQQVGRDLDRMEELRTERLATTDYHNEEHVIHALEGLYHDEHIHAALRLGVIDHAYIIQHSFDSIDPALAERGMHVLPTEINLKQSSRAEKQHYFDSVLESAFINRQLDAWQTYSPSFDIEKHDFILDIDLDVFKSYASIQPKCVETIKMLFKKACGITIARESEWIQRLKSDGKLDSYQLQEKLLYIFKTSK